MLEAEGAEPLQSCDRYERLGPYRAESPETEGRMRIKIVVDPEKITGTLQRFLGRQRSRVIAVMAFLAFTPLMLFAVTKPHTFHDGDPISASEINEDFDVLYDAAVLQDEQLDSIFKLIDDIREELIPSDCPSDMALGGEAGSESAFCIEIDERPSTSYYSAVKTCAALGRHVCTQNQFWVGTAMAGVNGMCNNWEWVGDWDDANTSGHLQVIIGGNGCTVQSWAWAGQHNNGNGNQPYRCCKGGISAIFD